MKKMLLSAAILIALYGCGAGGETLVEPAGIEAVEASADVERVGNAGSEEIIVVVTLHNTSKTAVELKVLLYCPVFLRVLDRAEPVYDGGDDPCPRAGRVVTIAAGKQATFTRSVPSEQVAEAGIDGGEYRVVAVVTNSPNQLEIDAGTLQL